MSTVSVTKTYNIDQLSDVIKKIIAVKQELKDAETSYSKGSAVSGASSIIYGIIGGPAAGTFVFLYSLTLDVAAKYYDNLVTIVRKIQWTMEDYEDLMQDNESYDLIECELTYKFVWNNEWSEKIAIPDDFKVLKIHNTSGGWNIA